MHNPKNQISFTILIISFFLCTTIQSQNDSLFEKHFFITGKNDTMPYRLMRPEIIDSTTDYPLVIFLHGAGERGTDNNMQLVNGPKNFANDSIRKKYPCYMVLPQCAKDHQWVDVDWKLPAHITPENPSEYMTKAMMLVDSLIKFLNIDEDRIYITGLSMGGFGTWDAISRWPDKFAAAVPVCGGGDTTKASVIKDIPVWAFHGDIDKAVNVSRSRDMISCIKKAGGNPKYTEYKNTGHNSWTPTYSNPAVIGWLFSQKRK